MAGKIVGRFYFKQTINRNLIGEFSNNHSPEEETKITTESADLIESSGQNFIGTYNATWQERGRPFCARLTISNNVSSNLLFELHWTGDSCSFEGQGMLCDAILIGNYWQV